MRKEGNVGTTFQIYRPLFLQNAKRSFWIAQD